MFIFSENQVQKESVENGNQVDSKNGNWLDFVICKYGLTPTMKNASLRTIKFNYDLKMSFCFQIESLVKDKSCASIYFASQSSKLTNNVTNM